MSKTGFEAAEGGLRFAYTNMFLHLSKRRMTRAEWYKAWRNCRILAKFTCHRMHVPTGSVTFYPKVY